MVVQQKNFSSSNSTFALHIQYYVWLSFNDFIFDTIFHLEKESENYIIIDNAPAKKFEFYFVNLKIPMNVQLEYKI